MQRFLIGAYPASFIVPYTGSDQERHLAGSSALLRASQGPTVDASTPGLRQAAFWVYIRQCLYNACVNQQSPNLDPDLLLIDPSSFSRKGDAGLGSETAWANTITWITATIVKFCFGCEPQDPREKLLKWEELSAATENWAKSRPSTFDPLWASNSSSGCPAHPFPIFYFSCDWHGNLLLPSPDDIQILCS